MNAPMRRWAPAALLFLGAAATIGTSQQQKSMALRAPLQTSVPTAFGDARGEDIKVSAAERRVAGMSDYVLRLYKRPGQTEREAFSIYVGYYDRQAQGKTIHSPKNCLPGGGWEPLVSSRERIQTAQGPVEVNRYLIQNRKSKALVLYWYQGRGRVAANEYAVKWYLLRDQALRGRSDEALVRVIVPVQGSEEEAFRQATRIAGELVGAVSLALPT